MISSNTIRNRSSWCALLLMLGCASRSHQPTAQPAPVTAQTTQTTQTTQPIGQPPATGSMCPMDVAGTEVVAMDTGDGIAIVFATPSGDVNDLRRRVQQTARMHEQKSAAGASGQDTMRDVHRGGPSPDGAGAMGPNDGNHPRVRSHASVEETDRGARIVMIPENPADLEALRVEVRAMADEMNQSKHCPMMGTQPPMQENRPYPPPTS